MILVNKNTSTAF